MHLDLAAPLQAALAERFAVQEELGRGGMAVVYHARDLREDREVAIKVLYPDLARAVAGDRFIREIGILSQLSHPNILTVLASGSFEFVPGLRLPWYAMPYAPGETLRARMLREGPLPVPDAIDIARQVCAALAHAHRQGIVHRDIKPENILLRDGRALVADFGVARAISVAGGDTLSSTGIVVGTPAYMSPEQSVGSDTLDGRSDVYSLGIVLYEMLAGHSPFTGATPQAVSARHQFEPPPPIAIVRPGLSPAIITVVQRALAKIPADRFRTADEFSAAMAEALAAPADGPRPARGRWWIAVSVLLPILFAGWWLAVSRLSGQRLDPSRFVVLPPASRDSATAFINSGESQGLIVDALSRWTDFSVVSPLTVGSAVAALHSPLTLDRAISIARTLGAGRAIWGEIARSGEEIRVTGVLYDARSRRELRSATVRLDPETADPGTLARRFAELTYELVLPGNPTPTDAAEALGARSIAAWRVFSSGDSALNAWNLDLAKRKYREALSLDPEYPNANLKLAQVGAWLDDPVEEWRPYAERARAAEGRLTRQNRLMAEGLLALASGDYPAACQQYRALIQRDSLDFRGWFGLGECLSRDPTVLPDSTSPSGWRFRTSYAAAVEAYTRALTLVPAAHLAYSGAALGRLADRLMAMPDRTRQGVPEDSSGRVFIAYPGLSADTLVFVPYPITDALKPVNPPATSSEALAANRQRLYRLTSSWLRHFPESRAAMLAQADALELLGRIDGPDSNATALGLTRRIRRTARGLDIGLAIRETRLLVKATRYGDARALAESTLAVPPTTEDEGVQLAALAALIGRPNRAADLMAEHFPGSFFNTRGELLTPPRELARDAARLLAYAGFMAPPESLTAIATRIRIGVTRQNPAPGREAMLEALLLQPSLLAFPLLQPVGDTVFPITSAELALARGNRTAALRALSAGAPPDAPELRAATPLDFALVVARLYAMAGDTAAARARLEPSLTHPEWLGLDLLESVSQAAAVSRTFRFSLLIGPPRPGLDTAAALLEGTRQPAEP